VPQPSADPDCRPIVLVSDRRRWLAGGIPLVLAALAAVALAILRASPLLVLLLIVAALAAYSYATGGKTGYYELRQDGSIGEFLGKRVPPVLSEMRRPKS